MALRDHESGEVEAQERRPPVLPPEVTQVEPEAPAAPAAKKPTKKRVAVAFAMLFIVAVQLGWLVVLASWIVRIVF